MKKRIPIRAWIYLAIAAGLTIFVIVNAFLPGNESTQAASPMVEISANVINWISPNTVPETRPEPFVNLVRKVIGHFGLFGLLGIFVYLSCYYIIPLKKKRETLWTFIPCLVYGAIIASLTELIQLGVPGRSGEVKDALIDFAGFATSVGLLTLLFLFVKKYKAKKEAK